MFQFRPAVNYQEQLTKQLRNMFQQDRYKYVLSPSGTGRDYQPNLNTDFASEFVWIDTETEEITGFVEMFTSYDTRVCHINFLVSFKEKNTSFLLGVKKLLENLFLNNDGIEILMWGACVDNPICKGYDTLCDFYQKKHNCTINKVRTFNGIRTFDGIVRDTFIYQVKKN